MNIGELKATLGVDTSNFDSGIRRSTSSLMSFKTAIAALGLTTLAYKLNQAAKEWENLYKKQEQAEAGLRQVMKSMDRYSDSAYENMLDIAKMMQQTTTFGDEAVIAGTRMLMTYKDISDDLMPRVIQAMTDLSALTGRDMVASANLMGRAAMGLTGELRRVGITVDQATYQSRGFLGILQQIESQVQGQARALAMTKSGGMEQFDNQVSDLKENLGLLTLNIKTGFVPTLNDIVTNLNGWFENQKKLQEMGLPNWFDKLHEGASKFAEDLKNIGTGFWTMAKKLEKAASEMDEIGFFGTLGGRRPSYREVPNMAPEGLTNIPGKGKTYPLASGLDYYEYMASKAKDAYADIEKESASFWDKMAGHVQSFDTTFSSMFADMLWGADVTFGDIAESFGRMLTQMTIQYQIAQPMFAWLSGLFGGGPAPVGVLPSGEAYMPGYAWAKGGVFDNGRIMAFARGGMVNRPTLFPMAGGAGLMGEAGPEAILPLKRTAGGELGVRAQGGGDIYNITNNIATYDMANFAEYFNRFTESNPGAITGPLQKARMGGRRV